MNNVYANLRCQTKKAVGCLAKPTGGKEVRREDVTNPTEPFYKLRSP